MQNNPGGLSGNQNPFGVPRIFNPNPPSFLPQTSSQTVNNPFQKINPATSTSYGMNMNTSSAPGIFGNRPRSQFPFQNTTSTFQFPSQRPIFQIPGKEMGKPQFTFSLASHEPKKEMVENVETKRDLETKHELNKDNKVIDDVAPKDDTPQPLPDAAAAPPPPQPVPTTRTGLPDHVPTTSGTANVSEIKAIVVHELPEELNNKLELVKLFQQFGNVVRVYPNIKKGFATIYYDSHRSAADAKKNGIEIAPGKPLKILFKQIPNRERRLSKTMKSTAKLPAAKDSEAIISNQTSLPEAEDIKKLQNIQKRNNAPVNLNEGIPMQITTDELKKILLQPTSTVAERATVLDARDKLVRLTRSSKMKSCDVQSVETLKGTCPDMCPEKERYLRVEKRRLAPYEILLNSEKEYTVDHNLAVKEYSRSSADQAEPLSHELRPLSVLKMTMDYLVSCIIDRSEKPNENLAEWYNFLWDRTRGIRKDLTQQSLCDIGAVILVEKCARFHIHCTARLCELDMQDFDQKINDENLTKCLQTLKHMYYDLSVKEIYCSNEAEFRAYDILLHLNVGDILREVQQWRPIVRESHEVKVALQLFNALNSRNYVRFFKLAKINSDYLHCCLLQRYFQQMRNSALQIMVQAYGPPKKGQIPLSNFIDILGFENEDEAAVWCQYHGLSVDVEKDFIILERATFIQMPDSFPPKRRSFKLIESKRTGSVGEIIEKGPLPVNPTLNHRPHNSFNENGILKKEAWLAEDQFIDTQVSVVPNKFQNLEHYSSLIFEEILQTTVNDCIRGLAIQTAREATLFKITLRIRDSLLEEVVSQTLVETTQTVLMELQSEKRRQEENRKEQERRREMFSQRMLDNVIDDVIFQQLVLLSKEEIERAKAEHNAKMREKFTHFILDGIIKEVTDSECEGIAKATAMEIIEKRENLISQVRQRVLRMRTRRCCEHWRRYAALKIKRRIERETFPACPSYLELEEQAGLLRSKGEPTNYPLKRKSVLEQVNNVKRFHTLSDLQYNISTMDSFLEKSSLDVSSILEPVLRKRLYKEPNHCWKIVILCADSDPSISYKLKSWLGFQNAEDTENGWLFLETKTEERPLTLCIRFVYWKGNFENYLHGANSVVIIYHPETNCQSVIQSLAEYQATITESIPFKLFTISIKADHNTDLVTGILKPVRHLEMDFHHSPRTRHLDLAKLFIDMVEIETPVHPVDLVSSTLWDFAETFVSQYILPIIYRNLKTRIDYGLLHQPLSVLLDLFNNGIQHLIDVVQDPTLPSVKWPAPEFLGISGLNFPPLNWNSSTYQSTLAMQLNRFLVLPTWNEKHQKFQEVCVTLRKYCSSLILNDDGAVGFMSRVNSILEKCISIFQKQLLNGEPQMENIPWTDIFQACIDYRFQAFMETGLNLKIAFSLSKFRCYQCSHQWNNASKWIAFSGGVTLNETLHRSKDQLENLEEKQSRTLPDMEKPCDVEQHLTTATEISDLCDLISEATRENREENERFDSMLRRVLLPENTSKHRVRFSSSSQVPDLTGLPLDSQLGVLENSLENCHRENRKFEFYLKNMLKQ